jgi:hypothetical protein
MSGKPPKDPVSAEPEAPPAPPAAPRQEIRETGSAEEAHRRAYPERYRVGPMLRRRSMRRVRE